MLVCCKLNVLTSCPSFKKHHQQPDKHNMSKRNNSDLTFDSEEDSDLDGDILSGVQAKKKRKVDEEDDETMRNEEEFDDPYDDEYYIDDADRD
jgi:hypothetical protein